MTRTHRPSQTCTVPDCGRDTGDQAYVCPQCGDRLVRLLALMPDQHGPRAIVPIHHPRHPGGTRQTGDTPTVPGLATALEDATPRQSVGIGIVPADEANGLPDETGPVHLPYGYRASEARTDLLTTLRATVADIAHRRGLYRPRGDLVSLAAWSTRHVQWLRQQPDGGDIIGDLVAALTRALRAVDRPADRRYAGPCTATTTDADGLAIDCPGELYARHGAPDIECPDCGAVYDVESRRAWLLDQANDRLLPATELARAVDGLGVPVTPSMIRNWRARGRILNRGTDTAPLYRVGDVIDIFTARHEGRTVTA